MIEIPVYRARIGTFIMPRKVVRRLRVLKVGQGTISVILRIVIVLSMLVTLGGDVELDPGPRGMRQRTLTFEGECNTPAFDTASQSQSSQETRTKTSKASKDSEVMSFLREMKAEMKSDLNNINGKITNINESLNTLKEENDSLKRENREIKEELSVLSSKLDKLEGHSRRNNLRFFGVKGRVTESWEDSEKAVRQFLSDNLGMSNSEDIKIERAHRVGSRHSDKCTIIAKFSSYKDKDEILKKARATLDRTSGYTVREDYTDRVLLHRRELGKRLVEARENGQYASLKFDKLVIDGNVYKYEEKTGTIIMLGPARGRWNPRNQHNGGIQPETSARRPLAETVNSNQGGGGSRDYHMGASDESELEGETERGAIGGML